MTSSSQVLTAMDQIIETWNHLQAYGITSHLVLDFSLIGSIDYYTGVYFEGYSSNLGFSLLSGGRYDHLLASFGRPLPATGFALYMHRVMEASGLQVDQPQSVVLCYTPEKHEQAIKKAMVLRKQGQAVVLHRLDDSENMNELTAYYDQVICCTGEEE
jgi:ATP phosphoribosyltransferase regulatory subunit